MQNDNHKKSFFFSLVGKFIYSVLAFFFLLTIVAINVVNENQKAQESEEDLAPPGLTSLYHLNLASTSDITSYGTLSTSLTRDTTYGVLQFDETNDQFTLPALVKYSTYRLDLVTGYEYGNLSTTSYIQNESNHLSILINDHQTNTGAHLPLTDYSYSFFLSYSGSSAVTIAIKFNEYMTKEIAGALYSYEYISLIQISVYGVNH